MRSATFVIAVVLIIVGVVSLVYEGITYTRSRTVIDVGPLEARVEEKRTVPLPPALGVLSLAGGILLLVVNSRRSQAA